MKKILAMLVCMLLLIGALPIPSLALNTEDIVILYENDVHCVIEGYSKLSAMKKELRETYAHVGVVSGGDFIQGNSLGVISRGEYVVKVMNLVGYDAVALGNHEFDFRMERLEELIGMMNTKPICCNFQKVGEAESHFKPYSMVEYGDVKIAYIGVTTPSTITSAAPAQFKDENGNFLYTFNPTTLYEIVQKNIDAAECTLLDTARSGIWYTENINMTDCEIKAPKTFRRSSHISLRNVRMTDASETMWNCDNVELSDVYVLGDYFGLGSCDIIADRLNVDGNYLFDGGKNIVIRNSRLISKDAFWNCENVTVIDSVIVGEYLGWNSKNLTFINCDIESNQGMCYIRDLTMKGCRLNNTDLCFEYCTVDAEISSDIISVKNPISGRIIADSIGEIIMDPECVDVTKTEIIEVKK